VLPGVSLGLLVAVIALNIYALDAGPADAWTYLAAGERLNAGHQLYALSPGDRPVDLKPPYWTVPLLSPPPIAVLWRPLALLPAEVAVAGWWILTMVAVALSILLAVRARPVFASLAVLVFLLPLNYEFANGNVNGLLLLGTIGAWLSIRSGRDRLAGVAVAAMTAVKLTPAVLLVWLLLERRWVAVRTSLATGMVLGLVSVLGAGPQAHLAYLDVMADTATVGPTQFSLAGLVERLGVAIEIARLAPPAALGVGMSVVALAARRGRPDVGFTAAVFTMVWGSPVMNFDWLSLLFAALAPGFWPLGTSDERAARAPEH
jgi:alpha-1,2-mannosyltransferase